MRRSMRAYEQPGPIRCGFDVYGAFSRDVEENRRSAEGKGSRGGPALSLRMWRWLL